MDLDRVFVSFWDICLSNFPEGHFKNTRLSPQAAKQLIDKTRAAGKLAGISSYDLMAPYKIRQLKKHNELIIALQEHYQINLKINDFIFPSEHDGEKYSSTIPVNLIPIESGIKLMVINSHLSFKSRELDLLKQKDRPFPSSQLWIGWNL